MSSERGPGRVLNITSLANPLVKEIRGLALPKNRKASGLFVAEGLKLVADALDAGWTVRHIIHSAKLADETMVGRVAATARARGGDIVAVNQAILEKISRRDNPQTVLGVFEQKLTPFAALGAGSGTVWVALEDVRDPGNLGTIIRTVDAVGGAGVMLVGDTVDPFSIEAVRATMGSIFHVPIVRASRADFIAVAGRWSGAVVGTHLSGTIDYRDVDYRRPVLLVMGGEQAGLTAEAAAACGVLAKIPMAGKADSLNLAIATGVMLFEALRGGLKLDG
jgi:TrmH family RNA methyltransferase